ncbi:hypothetical protein I5Q31_05585 [Serratia marcescens]|nr:hypothetical protein [Serratia marcescens]MBH2766640.1 hypothetical protein [Serratia marcescens]MBH2766700.1 hypothetical protein [Serratia marcescens]
MSRRSALWGLAVVGLASLGSAAEAETYTQTVSKQLTLTVDQDTSVTHSLTAVNALSDAGIAQDTLLATGTFSGSAHQYGFKWENRDGACGASLACSRVVSLEDPANYIDMVATFASPADTTSLTFPGYVVVDLGSGTAGQYQVRHMTDAAVKAGTYRVSTVIGVYTP